MVAELLENRTGDVLLRRTHVDLLAVAHHLATGYLTLSRREAADTIVSIEGLSRVIDHLQTLAARAAEDHQLATADTQGPCKNTAEYLRATIGISRSEANRRLRLGQDLLPEIPGPGATVEPRLATLATAASTGSISSRAATVVRDAVHRVSAVATRSQMRAMEEHLTRQAVESDEDILRVLARRWESVIDQDGQEPTEKTLRAHQGVFLRGKRHGLHLMEIGATDEQFEHLITVMTTATNPRAADAPPAGTRTNGIPAPGGSAGHAEQGSVACGSGSGSGFGSESSSNSGPRYVSESEFSSNSESGPRYASEAEPNSGYGSEPGRRTRAQELLDGLTSACRIVLAGDGLPATGGHRPQVMVTIDYRDLLSDLGHDGHSVFAGQLSARSIRKVACDADILPLVLGGSSRILDLGRSQRLFPPHLRRALVVRDKGCAFPDCMVPATWCEAHHIVPWAAGGTTAIDDGVLLCSWHHHVLHEGQWSVESVHGIPWFIPPRHLDAGRTPRRNR